MIKAVLFDLMGTVLERTAKGRDVVFSEFLRDNGRDVYFQEMAAAHDLVSKIDYPHGRARNEREYCERILQRLEVPYDNALLDGFERLSKSMNRFEIYPDVAPLLAELRRRGIKTAIVTTCRRFEFEPALKEKGLAFDFICTGLEAGAAKPNPRCYQTALKTLGVAPQDAIIVGDELDIDIVVPKKLGMKGVLLCRGEKLETSKADGVISSLSELVGFL